MTIHESTLNPAEDSDSAGGARTMSELTRRLLAGAWFALAAVIPVAYYFLFPPVDGGGGGGLPTFLLTAAVPIVISGIGGLALGSDILDAETTTNALQAVGRGLLVAGFSYLLLFTGSGLVLAFLMKDLIGLILLEFFIFLYGLFFIGWLLALVGAVAGLLLYLCRLKFVEEEKL
jgi:hypothetical protein